jgi:hypothetical protein
MLATGCASASVLLSRGRDINLNAGPVAVTSTVVRLKGRGLTVYPTKSQAGTRSLSCRRGVWRCSAQGGSHVLGSDVAVA